MTKIAPAKLRDLKPFCRIKAARIHRKVLAKAPGVEHYGFVAYAGVEVFHFSGFIWYVSVVLLVSGAGAVLWEKIK